jgi:hypothetical protein
MKIQNLVHDLLFEEIKNKKLFEFLLSKWFGNNPSEQQKMEAESLITRFQEIQNGLSIKRPQVVSFLHRFDGQHGSVRFEPDLIKDIKAYRLEQIRSLIAEYTDDELEVGGDAFSGKDTASTPEKVEASRALWEGEDNLIFNQDGLRVYNIKDQKMAVKYGYFVEKINKEQGRGNYPWCVTWRPDQGRTNMWGNYRSQGRSFYFVIDENKDPKGDRYYLGALQRDTSVSSGFRITSVLNDGDNTMTWDEVVRIYPQLKDNKELIAVKNYSQDELEEKNAVGQITEREGSQFEFKRVDRQLKKAYINNLGSLKKPESWQSMDEKLRALYVSVTRQQDVTDKFSNFAFLSEIKKVGSEFTLLDNKIKQLGHKDGVGYIFDHLMKQEFKVARTSIDNPNIRLYESKVNGKFGLYNSKRADWVAIDNVKYEPLYKDIDISPYFDEEGNSYLVETFSTSFEVDNTSLFCIYPIDDASTSGHFLTFNGWNSLKEKLSPEDETQLKDFNPETDVDIKEMKKGF